MPKTIFSRLFMLIVLAILASQLMTIGLMIAKFGTHFHHADFHARQHSGAAQWEAPFHPSSKEPETRKNQNDTDIGLPPRPPIEGLIFGLLIQFGTLAVAAWYGARLLAKPIQQLAQAAEQLGDDLNASPIEEIGPTEAKQAAKIFNDMQKRVRGQVRERELFLAAVSHDLRTPLTRMRLRLNHLDDSEVKEKLRQDIAEMAVMLEAAMNYIRDKSIKESWQLLDVNALVDAMVENAKDSDQDVSCIGTAKPLLTQPMALKRCLGNLVDNALRYGKKAEIIMLDRPDSLLIEVRDDGPGIPEQMMAAVLEPFVRLESSRNKTSGGVGLGLAIAKDAAILCGGRLTLQNAKNGGLIARVSLSRKQK
ncbi:MAG: ATP-binding protein [Burkholderiaceae bacterium]